MVSNKILTAKVLVVTAREMNPEPGEHNRYEFEVLEYENGLIAVSSETTHDWYFEDRDSIEPNGLAVVESIQESGEVRQYPAKFLLKSIQGSIREFGVDAVPQKHVKLWKQ